MVCIIFRLGDMLIFLFVFPLMVVILSDRIDAWVCMFVLFVVLDEASCTGFYCCLGEARSYIQVVSFVGFLTI